MTRYYIDFSTLLTAQYNNGDLKSPEGWRFVERWGPRYADIERWIVEDDYAGEEFEGLSSCTYFSDTPYRRWPGILSNSAKPGNPAGALLAHRLFTS